jgi:hypothetical protein
MVWSHVWFSKVSAELQTSKVVWHQNVLIFGLGNFGSFRNFGHFHVIPNLLKPIGNKAPHLQITYHQSFWSFLLVMTQWVLQTVRKLWLAMLSKFTNRGKHLYQCPFAVRPDYPINPSMPELHHIYKGWAILIHQGSTIYGPCSFSWVWSWPVWQYRQKEPEQQRQSFIKLIGDIIEHVETLQDFVELWDSG